MNWRLWYEDNFELFVIAGLILFAVGATALLIYLFPSEPIRCASCGAIVPENSSPMWIPIFLPVGR